MIILQGGLTTRASSSVIIRVCQLSQSFSGISPGSFTSSFVGKAENPNSVCRLIAYIQIVSCALRYHNSGLQLTQSGTSPVVSHSKA